MEDENGQQNQSGEQNATQTEPPANNQTAQGGESGSQQSQSGEASGEQGSTVNRHKHERELGKLQDRIKELEAANAKLQGEADGISAIEKHLNDMEAKAAREKVEDALKAAGCRNVKAAMACLDDHKGDIEALKKAEPYMFESADKSKSTGGTPKGAASSTDLDAKLDKAFGL